MFKDTRYKLLLRESRLMTLEAMKIALKIYSETKDEEFLEHAKRLGSDSVKYKEMLELLK